MLSGELGGSASRPNLLGQNALFCVMRFVLLLFVGLMLSQVLLAQPSLQGTLLDAGSRQPLPYASLQLWPSQRGTIANEAGAFVLPTTADDSLFISLVGYRSLRLALTDWPQGGLILLEPQVRILAEVAVRPSNDDWLYELVRAINLGAANSLESRAYYELKSKVGSQQVELVEAFYNLQTQQATVQKLQVKAGRLALQPVGQRLFANTEGVQALAAMPLFKAHPYFPGTPLSLNGRALKKRYTLYDLGGYRLDGGDSVQVLRFVPNTDKEAWFEGELGILTDTKRLLFLELRCDQTKRHPFVPMGADDRLSQVSLHLKRSMLPHGESMRLEKLELAYEVTYTNARGQVYPVESRALLFSYAPQQPFFVWEDGFTGEQPFSDYLRINALPYNPAFWEAGNETRIEDVQGANQAFFKHPNSLTNVNLFTNQPLLGKGLLERPFTHWNGKRLIFNGQTERPPNETGKREVRVDDFHLAVSVYFDLNRVADSLHWQTATIFNPYQSYFYLPIQSKEACFINLYFDLMECERRRLEGLLLASERHPDSLMASYRSFKTNLEEMSQQYFRDAMLGNNRKGMESWNERVLSELGINNMQLFGLLE